jgi:TetR/AcrR family transcriptional regulator, transcriptional repressor for nem operon
VTNSRTGASGNGAVGGPGKRGRLIFAARRAFYEQGVEATTIADIARTANVPTGNVYYYFKTKQELLAAVMGQYHTMSEELTAALDRRRTPVGRLRGLIDTWIAQRRTLALYGCPIGTLCSELDKGADRGAPNGAAVLESLLFWIEQQFRDMGRSDARELAIALLSAYEGVSVLAHAMGDPQVIAAEGRRLKRWIEFLQTP